MEEVLYHIIGQRIKESRERCGVTQEELAESIGLTRTSVTNMEAGRQKFQVGKLYRVCKALRISPHELFPSMEEVSLEQVNSVSLPPNLDNYSREELNWVVEVIKKGKQSEGDR